jgi:hypothetical protein
MFDISSTQKTQIKSLVRASQEDTSRELEVLIHNTKLTKNLFEKIYARLKNLTKKGMFTLSPETTVLDISPLLLNKRTNTYYNDMRFSVGGIGSVKQYCQTNDINKVKHTVIRKNRAQDVKGNFYNPVKVFDYNIRFNLKTEKDISNLKQTREVEGEWNEYLKDFRYKKRYSFVSKDKLFSIDLTCVKSSNFNNRRPINKKRTLQESGTLESKETYEVEIEFLNPKKGKSKDVTVDKIFGNFFKNILIILQVTENCKYIISEKEKRSIKAEYLELVGFPNEDPDLIRKKHNVGPQPVSLSLAHLNPNSDITVYDNYTVTEKADGERHLIFISKDGKVYGFNSNLNRVTYLGFDGISTNYRNSLLDSEIIKDHKGKKRCLLFDAYFVGGKNVAGLRLMDSKSDNRISKLLGLLKNNAKLSKHEGNIVFSVKKFKPFSKSPHSKILRIGAQSIINDIKYDGYDYETDGLIFTPICPIPENVRGRTWNKILKWKPAKDNSIDFYVRTVQESCNAKDNCTQIHKDLVTTKHQSTIRYKQLLLHVGFDAKKHNVKYNIKDLIAKRKSPKYERTWGGGGKNNYINTEFVATEPYDEQSYITNIELSRDDYGIERMLCKDGDEVKDGMIVEMSYDATKPRGWRWIPRNIRHDKLKPNDYQVAQNIWTTYYNPVTEEIITGHGNISDIDTDAYYTSIKKNDMINMFRFHNNIKRNLLQATVKRCGIDNEITLLDLACGKGGDIAKWRGVSTVVGVDISRDGIENTKDGAYERYFSSIYENKLYPESQKMYFLAGDSSKMISNGKAGMTNDYSKMMRIMWGDKSIAPRSIKQPNIRDLYGIADNKFDIISIQFAFHYFFKSEQTFNGVLKNIVSNIKDKGYFVGTCFDGNRIYKKLANIPKGESISGASKSGDTLWRIKKEYTNAEALAPNGHIKLGTPITVFMQNFNTMETEWLVDFDYVTEKMEKLGFELVSEVDNVLDVKNGSFKNLMNKLDELKLNKRDLEMMTRMSESERGYSELNRYFVFQKVADKGVKFDVDDMDDDGNKPKSFDNVSLDGVLYHKTSAKTVEIKLNGKALRFRTPSVSIKYGISGGHYLGLYVKESDESRKPLIEFVKNIETGLREFIKNELEDNPDKMKSKIGKTGKYLYFTGKLSPDVVVKDSKDKSIIVSKSDIKRGAEVNCYCTVDSLTISKSQISYNIIIDRVYIDKYPKYFIKK